MVCKEVKVSNSLSKRMTHFKTTQRAATWLGTNLQSRKQKRVFYCAAISYPLRLNNIQDACPLNEETSLSQF